MPNLQLAFKWRRFYHLYKLQRTFQRITSFVSSLTKRNITKNGSFIDIYLHLEDNFIVLYTVKERTLSGTVKFC